MRAQEFISEGSVRDEITRSVKKHGGSIDDYYVRFTDQDKLGYSQRQHIGRSPDIDDPAFDVEYIGYGKGRPALWFYPLRYYLRNAEGLYAADKPYVWLVRLKPDAWLQSADTKTKAVAPAPEGKQRVGIMRQSSVPAAIFFRPGFEVVDRFYDYGSQHQRHGRVKGAQPPGLLQQIRDRFSLNELKIDNDKGLGAVPKNKDVDYFGLDVKMRPSTFLKLALPLSMTEKDRQVIADIAKRMDDPGFGAPFLEIDIPDAWESGDVSEPATITGHDGRHRMHAIMAQQGDEPVEVHLFPLGLRRRHFEANPQWIQRLNKNIVSQRRMPVTGPLFQV